MTTEPSRRARRGPAVRRAVLDATVQAVLADGLHAARVADIAGRAGVHETSIYRRWGTRENLVVDALMERADLATPLPDTGSVRQDLITFLGEIAAFVATAEGSAFVHLGTVAVDDNRLAAARREFWTARLRRASALVERGVRRGELPAASDALLLIEVLVAPLYLRVLLTGEPVDRELVLRLVDLALAGPRLADQRQ